LIHGATMPSWQFDRVVPYLAEAGFRTIRLDLYGHGYSDRPTISHDYDLFGRQVSELLERLDLPHEIDLLDYLSFAKTVSGSLDGRLRLSGRLETWGLGTTPACRRPPAVDLARWDPDPRGSRRTGQKEDQSRSPGPATENTGRC
jgi:hypothetical protein